MVSSDASCTLPKCCFFKKVSILQLLLIKQEHQKKRYWSIKDILPLPRKRLCISVGHSAPFFRLPIGLVSAFQPHGRAGVGVCKPRKLELLWDQALPGWLQKFCAWYRIPAFTLSVGLVSAYLLQRRTGDKLKLLVTLGSKVLKKALIWGYSVTGRRNFELFLAQPAMSG